MPDADEHIGEVTAILAHRMATAKGATSGPGIVFVLGAGCSMQYGLPGFDQLLRCLYEDIYKQSPDKQDDLNALRHKLELFWRFSSEHACKELLRPYLSGVKGDYCPGYRYLAQLAKQGFLQGIVNMNFDPLLAQALKAENVSFTPWSECPDALPSQELAVITPHGTLADPYPRDNKFILDIGNSNLFLKPEQEDKTRIFFGNNDVVVIGYAGGDATIAQALLWEQNYISASANNDRESYGSPGPRPPYLFVINPTSPNAQLIQAISQRKVAELYVTGPEANFENFIDLLCRRLLESRRTSAKVAPRTPSKIVPDFGREEEEALRQCNQLAHYLRSTMNVAEASRITLEAHGDKIFQECNKIAAAMDLPLTVPERFLVQAAAYLHDLGYFAAYSGSGAHSKAGLNLLLKHGSDTARLLQDQIKEDDELKLRIIPRTYPPETQAVLLEMLITLCKHHSFPDSFPLLSEDKASPIDDDSSIEDKQSLEKLRSQETVRIGEFEIPIRFDLIHALFAAAEELSEGHPFFPSPYSLERTSLEQAIEDPILSLYLDQKSRDVTFRIEHRKIVALVKPALNTPPSKTTIWLCGTARDTVKRLNRVGTRILRKGKSAEDEQDIPRELIRFAIQSLPLESEAGASGTMFFGQKRRAPEQRIDMDRLQESINAEYVSGEWAQKPLIRGALEERLKAALMELETRKDKVGLAASILDLIAIYALPEEIGMGKESEPRAQLSTPTVRKAFESYKEATKGAAGKSHRGLLDLYFEKQASNDARTLSVHEKLDSIFIKSFNLIYYPAWRFCGKSWRAGNDPVCMGRVSLDLGSSRYRGEVISGLRYLVYDKIIWDPDNECAYGHDGCMLCTSRLLYILASARLLFPKDHLNLVASREKFSPDVIVNHLLSYMLNLPVDNPGWWGVPKSPEASHIAGDHSIRSADYIAWAIRSLAFTLKVIDETSLLGDRTWADEIPVQRRAEIAELIKKLLRRLAADKTTKTVLSKNAEEPHPYILGELGTTYLFISSLSNQLGLPDESLMEHAEILKKAVHKLVKQGQPHLSRFFMWPALVFLHQAYPSERSKYETAMTSTLGDCVDNPVWIRQGGGFGSWGNNLENTQRIVSSLNTFWRYVYKSPENQERFSGLLKNS